MLTDKKKIKITVVPMGGQTPRFVLNSDIKYQVQIYRLINSLTHPTQPTHKPHRNEPEGLGLS